MAPLPPQEWNPSETPPPVAKEPIPIWIALRGGAIVPGYYFRKDEFIPLKLARWFEATTLAEVEAQYWMLRRECDPIPEPPL